MYPAIVRSKGLRLGVITLAASLSLMVFAGAWCSGPTWGEPVNLGPTLNGSAADWGPAISHDGLTLFYSPAANDICVSTRESIGGAWSAPTPLPNPPNTPELREGGPCPTADGLTLYYQVMAGGGPRDIWFVTRPDLTSPWQDPTPLPANINTEYSDYCPTISADGLMFFLSSDRPGGYGGTDIYVCTRASTDAPWSDPVNLGETVNTSADEGPNSVSCDGRTLYLNSNRPGGYGESDIYCTTYVGGEWTTPVNIGPVVNSSNWDGNAYMTTDGTELFFSSDRAGGYGSIDMWVSTLVPGPDVHVDDDAPGDPGPGDPTVSDPLEDGTAAHPYDAIQEGIDAASTGGAVLVAHGTYTGPGNRDLDFGCKAIAVRSENGPDVTVIDCQGSEIDPHRGFYFHSGETEASVVDGFTIRNGYVTGDWPDNSGGGISCVSGSSPTSTNSTITNNAAAGADGHGGGIFCYWYCNATIANCTISDNTAGQSAENYGFLWQEAVMTDQGAPYGGGMSLQEHDNSTVFNCLIIGNSGDGGGGIAVGGYSTSTIASCTISANTGNHGGGINCHSSESTVIINCILWENVSGTEIFSQYGPPTVTYCDVEGGYAGQGNIDEDPLFVSGPLHGYYLSETAAGQGADSPCIDAGSDTAANLGLDDRTTRTDEAPDVGIVDMGYHAEISPRIRGDVDGNGIVDGLDLTAVLAAWDSVPGHPRWNPAADLDGSGYIDGLDLTEVISHWTTGAASSDSASPRSGPLTLDSGTRRRVSGNVRRGSGTGNVRGR